MVCTLAEQRQEYILYNFSPGAIINKDITLDDTTLPRVTNFKYLGPTITEDGSIELDIVHRTTLGWNK